MVQELINFLWNHITNSEQGIKNLIEKLWNTILYINIFDYNKSRNFFGQMVK